MSQGFTHESTYNESKEWYTPRRIFDALKIDFDLDPCSPGRDLVPWVPAQIHFDIKDNGLVKEWFGNCWVNPPYGSDTPKWMNRLKEHSNGIALVFARTDTKWFHDYVPHANAICFIKGRVQFVPSTQALFYADGLYQPQGGCGAGSILIAFGEDNAKALWESGLGLTLPVCRNVEPFRTVMDFAGGSRRPNENLPHLSEHRQRIINAASAELRKNKNVL